MTDPTLFINLFVYFIFFAVIIYLLFDRASLIESYQKEKDRLLDELSKAIKAVIAKNANEYVMTTSIDKVAPEDKKEESEEEQEVPLDAISDDEFDTALGIKRKAPQK